MKKIIITLCLSFFTNFIFSQVFSVYDSKNSEIYGYVVFEEIERVDRRNNQYLATLLDINLNRVSQIRFTDGNDVKIGNIRYNGKTIYFEVIPKKSNRSSIASRDFTFRIIDLKENSISGSYKLPKVDKNLYVRGSYPIQDKGYGLILRNFKTQVNQFYAFSNTNQTLYNSFPYGNPKKKRELEHIRVGDIRDNLLVTINRKWPNRRSKDAKTSLLYIDLFTGNTIKEIDFDNENFNVEISDVHIFDENTVVYGDTYAKRDRFDSGKTSGLYKAVTSHNGDLIKEKALAWSDLQSKIDIKEGGFVSNKGFIYTHAYVLDKHTNHTIVVGEYIRGSISSVSVRDMVFLDFNEDFELHQVFEVEKRQSTLNLGGLKLGGSRQFANTLKANNYFDYRFYNPLENESGLSFFYFNVEKLFLIGSSSFSHGIVVYKDGNFTANSLKWETSIWRNEFLNLLPSKPGYFLLSKRSKDKILENRLERIDY
jgi:hypothetical protein